MARLEFVKDAGGNITKVAEGMYSKDDVNEEYVKLHHRCDCTGQVGHQKYFNQCNTSQSSLHVLVFMSLQCSLML